MGCAPLTNEVLYFYNRVLRNRVYILLIELGQNLVLKNVKDSPGWFLEEDSKNKTGISDWINFEDEEYKIYFKGYCFDPKGLEISYSSIMNSIILNGTNALEGIDGNFAVIVINKIDNGCWCATDTKNTLPLFYTSNNKGVFITDHPKNVLAFTNKKIDELSLFSIFNSQYVWGDLTLFEDTKQVNVGSILKISPSNEISTGYYFNPKSANEQFDSVSEFLQILDKELVRISNKYSNILVPLSGGVDSRLIAVRLHKLGIKFETVTFSADIVKGDDYDIAKQVADSLGVVNHKWKWEPREDFIEVTKPLIEDSFGLNSAFTSYPDGMRSLKELVKEDCCIIRGDENFGWGDTSNSIHHALWSLNIRNSNFLSDNVDKKNISKKYTATQALEKCNIMENDLGYPYIDSWKQEFYRKTRIPNLIFPVMRWHSKIAPVEMPFLSREMLENLANTSGKLLSDKYLAREALNLSSTTEVRDIPFSSAPSWKGGEPLLNLPEKVIEEMVTLLNTPSSIDEYINSAEVGKAFLEQRQQFNEHKINLPKTNLKDIFVSSAKQNIKRVSNYSFFRNVQDKIAYKSMEANKLQTTAATFKILYGIKRFLATDQKTK